MIRPLSYAAASALVMSITGCSIKEHEPLTPPSTGGIRAETRRVAVDLGDGRTGWIARAEIPVREMVVKGGAPSSFDKPPIPLALSGPIYPPKLLARRIAGMVVVRFQVDEAGAVRSVKVESATHREFGEAAVAAVVSWRFKPATFKGKPVKATVGQVIQFRAAPGSSRDPHREGAG